MERIHVSKSYRLGKANYKFIADEGWELKGSVDGIDMWVDDAYEDASMMEVWAIDPKTKSVIAHVVLNHKDGIVWEIEMVSIDSKYQGFGIAPIIYYWIMSSLRVSLLAGSQQSPGGRGIWYDLADIPGVTVLARREGQEVFSYTERDDDSRELYCDEFQLYGFDDVEMIAVLDRWKNGLH